MRKAPSLLSFSLFAVLLVTNLYWDKKCTQLTKQVKDQTKIHLNDSTVNETNWQCHLRDSARLDRMLNIKIQLDKKYNGTDSGI